jgi:hypothetical protein
MTDKPATQAEIAAMEFEPIAAWRNVPTEDRVARHRQISSQLYQFSVIAGQIVSFEKAELVQKMRDEYDLFGPMLMQLVDAGETAKGIVELLSAAETRLAVALANVEPDPDAPPRRPVPGRPKLFSI